MAETLLSIQEVAALTGKSLQTIRRAIKGHKLEAKRKKTPQGFNYLITQESVASFYKFDPKSLNETRAKGGLAPKNSRTEVTAYATLNDLHSLQKEVSELLEEYKKEKESFMRFMKAFQERFVVLENQLKLLEEPKAKHWYQFWK